MANPLAIRISNVRIDQGSLAYDWDLDPPADVTATTKIALYTATGELAWETDMGAIHVDAGRAQAGIATIPAWEIADGDYGAWVTITTHASDTWEYAEATEGASAIVARGKVYPSSEHVPDPIPTGDNIELLNARIEGTWVVADLHNKDDDPVTVLHELVLGADFGPVTEANGEETVAAKSTQQIHYLLPEQLQDGEYWANLRARPAGSHDELIGGVTDAAHFSVSSGVITVLPG